MNMKVHYKHLGNIFISFINLTSRNKNFGFIFEINSYNIRIFYDELVCRALKIKSRGVWVRWQALIRITNVEMGRGTFSAGNGLVCIVSTRYEVAI